jgi:S1-C subfamily serine protease
VNTFCGSLPTRGLFFFLLLSAYISVARADKLTITSTPPGATVGSGRSGARRHPFEKTFPGGYFHKTKTVFGARLEYPLVVRISLAGFATKEMQITEGPMNWIDYHGRHHGEYWLLNNAQYHVDLEHIEQVFTGSVAATSATVIGGPDSAPELPMEDVIARTKPAVVYLKGLEKAGTGFFVSDTGVIATNAHVALGEELLLTLLPDGVQLEGRVVYIDGELDIALVKVDGHGLPYLTLADASGVRQGENVMAVGNPGDAMLFSVTEGHRDCSGKVSERGTGNMDSDGYTNQSREQRRAAAKWAWGSCGDQHAEAGGKKCERNRVCAERDGLAERAASILSGYWGGHPDGGGERRSERASFTAQAGDGGRSFGRREFERTAGGILSGETRGRGYCDGDVRS